MPWTIVIAKLRHSALGYAGGAAVVNTSTFCQCVYTPEANSGRWPADNTSFGRPSPGSMLPRLALLLAACLILALETCGQDSESVTAWLGNSFSLADNAVFSCVQSLSLFRMTLRHRECQSMRAL
jgi:hypothetical protein